MKDPVTLALEASGDAANAWLWRGVLGHLAGPLRVAVVGRDERLLVRLLRHLGEGVDGVPVVFGAESDTPLLLQDQILPVHALLFATPVTAPLTASEREVLASLPGLGAPAARAVVVADTELLAEMSDHPEAESAEVAARVRTLTPAGWAVVEEGALDRFVGELRSRRATLTAERRREVGRLLLGDAVRRAEAAAAAARSEHDRVTQLLAAETAALAEAERQGERTAAHLLSAARRQTERLLVDLSTFLTGLEADLPAQVAAVPDLETLRRALPHWLHHVVEQWMSDRVVAWRADVDAELADLGIAEEELARAELLVPAVHAQIPHTPTGWTQRIGVTAALGSGAALLVFGLWIPGLLALGGGALYSALGRRVEGATHRRALTEAAIDVLRRMGADADRLLRDQIAALEGSLRSLRADRARTLEAERAATRGALEAERTHRALRHKDLEAIRDRLRHDLEALG